VRERGGSHEKLTLHGSNVMVPYEYWRSETETAARIHSACLV
jgi:hypothetical protein